MEESMDKNHIQLGLESQKIMIFKVFDALCVYEGPVNKVFGKSITKNLAHDPIDYLKTRFKVETDSIPVPSVENGVKVTKKNLKRKLFCIKHKFAINPAKFIRYCLPLLESKASKLNSNDEICTWFSEKLISKKTKKDALQTLIVQSEAVYVNPYFYKSKADITFDGDVVTFELFLKEWLIFELSKRHVNTITVYSKYPFIKMTVCNLIFEEMTGLYSKHGLLPCDMFKCTSKKAAGAKDVLLLFINRQFSFKEFEYLCASYGCDKVQWNDSEIESKEILENALHKNPYISEILVNKGRPNWSIIFKAKPLEKMITIQKPPALKNLHHLNSTPSNPNKMQQSPLPSSTNIHQSSQIVPLQNSPLPIPVASIVQKLPITKPFKIHQQSPIGAQTKIATSRRSHPGHATPPTKVGKHILSAKHTNPPQTNPLAAMPQPNPLAGLLATHQNIPHPGILLTHQNMQQPNLLATHHNMQQSNHLVSHPNMLQQGPIVMTNPNMLQQSPGGIINYIVTPTKYDPMANIFNRISGESQTALPNGSVNMNVTPTLSLNQFLGNGTRPSQQVINVPLMVNVESGTPVSNVPKPAPSTHLVYLPNRNMSNVFETFHYNPSPDSDVLIHGSDLLCLNFGQYLNDNIINFYLNYIRYEIMTEDQRQRTHLFNVFFNTKLQGSAGPTTTDTPEMKHARVAKWTKKVDIFDKDFIIIPINENQHWFLAIVCFPWMAGMISYDMLLGLNTNQTPSEIPVNNTLFATKHRVERLRQLREEYGVEPSPCILLFDSLQYTSRAPNVKLIRDYLKSEWDSKRRHSDGPLVFDKNTVRGFNPQVPQQTNTIDCGIFVLHYVEQFFSNPLKVFTKEYFQSSLQTWFEAETVAKKRAAIQKMVLDKADEYMANDVSHNSCDLPSATNTALDESGPDIQML